MAHNGRSRPDEPFRASAGGAPDATASAASGPLGAAAREHGSDADPSLPREAEEPTRPDAELPAQDAEAPAQRSAKETDQAGITGSEQGDAGSSDAAAADGDAERQLQEDLEELAAKAEKADEYLALAQRTQADFENYRKRATREAALAQQRGVGRLARELLPAIDNLERAVQAAAASATPATAGSTEDPAAAVDAPQTAAQQRPAADSPLLDGLRLVHAEVLAALARAGIEQFTPLGEAFDPQHHEAVAQHPVQDASPGSVVEVYQPGYRLGETVLRPARVLVAA